MSDFNSKMSDSTEDDSGGMTYGPKALNFNTEIPKMSPSEQDLLRRQLTESCINSTTGSGTMLIGIQRLQPLPAAKA